MKRLDKVIGTKRQLLDLRSAEVARVHKKLLRIQRAFLLHESKQALTDVFVGISRADGIAKDPMREIFDFLKRFAAQIRAV